MVRQSFIWRKLQGRNGADLSHPAAPSRDPNTGITAAFRDDLVGAPMNSGVPTNWIACALFFAPRHLIATLMSRLPRRFPSKRLRRITTPRVRGKFGDADHVITSPRGDIEPSPSRARDDRRKRDPVRRVAQCRNVVAPQPVIARRLGSMVAAPTMAKGRMPKKFSGSRRSSRLSCCWLVARRSRRRRLERRRVRPPRPRERSLRADLATRAPSSSTSSPAPRRPLRARRRTRRLHVASPSMRLRCIKARG